MSRTDSGMGGEVGPVVLRAVEVVARDRTEYITTVLTVPPVG